MEVRALSLNKSMELSISLFLQKHGALINSLNRPSNRSILLCLQIFVWVSVTVCPSVYLSLSLSALSSSSEAICPLNMVERADEEWKRLEREHKSREKTSEGRIGIGRSSHARERERVCEEEEEKECARKFRATSFLRIILCGGEKNRRTKSLDDFWTGLPTIIEEDEEEEEATPLKIKAKKATARYH